MKPTYEHIIWDWNGTLLDDTWLCIEIMNGILARRGKNTITVDTYRQLFDFPVIRYYERLGFVFDADGFDKISVEFIGAYEKRRFECALQEGCQAVLQVLSAGGFIQSILSAYKQETLNEFIEYYRLGGHFAGISGQSNIYAESKIEIGRQHMEKLQAQPERTLLVGDTVHDHEVATALGLDCLLFDRGHHPPDKLHSCNVPVISSLYGVISHLGGLS